ncbi:MAG: hypothetical protein LBR26_05830 [Prevotella sp.]|jgi:hypothetical protein|nr:hypothetical protein [Prevotella sp.]
MKPEDYGLLSLKEMYIPSEENFRKLGMEKPKTFDEFLKLDDESDENFEMKSDVIEVTELEKMQLLRHIQKLSLKHALLKEFYDVDRGNSLAQKD